MNAIQEVQTQAPIPLAPVAEALLPLSPEQVDALIAEYRNAQEICREADAVLLDAKMRLILAVDNFGQVPPHAEQSRRLEGRHNLATVTRSNVTTVNEDAVRRFQAFLAEAGYHDLFPRFFVPQTKHVLVEGARDVLKSLTLPRRVEEKIASLWGKAFDVKAKSPALKVEIVKPEKPAKQPRGKKVA